MTVLKGRYELLEQLGEGGMATVYRARQLNLSREVAIKFIKADITDPQFKERFNQEARLVAALSHPNILNIFDFDQAEDGRPFMVTELLRGQDLSQELRTRTTPYALDEAVPIIRDVAAGLGHAHTQGIVHRDVKPSNIFLTANRAVMMDFGIARLTSASQYTSTGMIVGTPHYFAPEQALGQPLDQRADIYALGIVFYEMIIGETPFKADTTMAVIAQHIHAPIPDPREKRPDLPPLVTAVILQALAKAPDERYLSMADFTRHLNQLIGLPGGEGATSAPLLVNVKATQPNSPTEELSAPGSTATRPAADASEAPTTILPTGAFANPGSGAPNRFTALLIAGVVIAVALIAGVAAIAIVALDNSETQINSNDDDRDDDRPFRPDSVFMVDGTPQAAPFDGSALPLQEVVGGEFPINPPGQLFALPENSPPIEAFEPDFPVAEAGEYLVVVADVVGDDAIGIDVTRRLSNTLRTGDLALTLGENFRLEETHYAVSDAREAGIIAERTGALMVVWGVQDVIGLEVVVQAFGYEEDTLTELRFTIPSDDNFAAVLTDDMPVTLSVYAQILALQELLKAQQLLTVQAIIGNWHEALGERDLRTQPTTTLERNVMEFAIAYVRGEYEQANVAATQVLRLVPNDPAFLFMRWNMNALLVGDTEAAMDDARRIERLYPRFTLPLGTEALSALLAGDAEGVLAATEDLDLSAVDEFTYTMGFYRSLALIATGQYAEAFALDETLYAQLQANPDTMDATYFSPEGMLAFLYEIQGEGENITAYREQINTTRTTEFLSNSRDIYFQNENLPELILPFALYMAEVSQTAAQLAFAYDAALDMYPANTLLNWRRARLYEAEGDYAAAYQHYVTARENAAYPLPIVAYDMARLVMAQGEALEDPLPACDLLSDARAQADSDAAFYDELLQDIAAAESEAGCGG